MNKLIIILISLVLLNSCSFNENSRIWNDKKENFEVDKNIKKLFDEDKNDIEELNQNLKLNLSSIKRNNGSIINNQNNLGSQLYNGELKKIGVYKFSKLKETNQLNFEPVFLKDGIIFFDNKGSIIKYDRNQKIVWKKNYYSKAEKKLRPKLNFFLDNKNLLVFDNLAKYYSLDINNGELKWLKDNIYPFNSEIKKYEEKIFVVDYENTLRCYEINDGEECWKLQTEDSFTISNNKYSIIIVNDHVIFSNSLGDITSVEINTGLINWQLPTQSSSIINKTYNLKISKLVSDGSSIFFSNNKNEFYSIDVKTGTINWVNKINSFIAPALIADLIFTISNEGYLYVVEKKNGNIIKVKDLYLNYKTKKRDKIYPVGFVIGQKNLYLTNSDGKMIVVELNLGNIIREEKISGSFVSQPFIFNRNLYIVRNSSIVEYN